MRRKIWLEVSVIDLVLRTKVQNTQDKMHSILSPQGKVRPSQHPLKVARTVRIRGFGGRVDMILIPHVRKEITIIEGRNLSRIVLYRVVNKILVEVVHHILVLLRVVVGQYPTFLGNVTLVANLAINLMIVPSNHL